MFNRLYKITIRTLEGGSFENLTEITTPIEGEEGTEGLQMTASFTMSVETGGTSSQTGTLSLTNLNKETKALVNNIDAGYVIIQAGYGEPFSKKVVDELPVLYVGDIQKVSTSRKGNDFETKFNLKTGAIVLKSSKVVRTFNAGRTVKFIAEEIAKSFIKTVQDLGVINSTLEIKTNLPPALENKTMVEGWVADGKTDEELTEFLEQFSCDFKIINNILYIKEKQKDVTKTTNRVIMSADNVKGTVERVTDNVDQLTLNSSETLRFKFRSFLEPEINPESSVVLPKDVFEESEEAAGEYVLVTHKVSLDYRGKLWDSVVEVKEKETITT